MSAVEISFQADGEKVAPRFHIVREGEISGNHRRRAFAQTQAHARSVVAAKTYAALGSMAAVFTAAAVTIVWAFLAIPNSPLP